MMAVLAAALLAVTTAWWAATPQGGGPAGPDTPPQPDPATPRDVEPPLSHASRIATAGAAPEGGYPDRVMIRGKWHAASDYSDVPAGGAATGPLLEEYALALANAARADHGLPQVAQSYVRSAQWHADDMLENGYFSHWDTRGVKPYATYTEAGGLGLVSENIAYVAYYCPADPCVPTELDPYDRVRDLHWSMMHDDAHADWGHRDTMLDPAHTHANFGVAYDDDRLYFAQHFESNQVSWDDVSLEGGMLRLAGSLPAGHSVDAVEILRDPAPRVLSPWELDGKAPYDSGRYEFGEGVMLYVKPPEEGHYYEECRPSMLEVGAGGGAQKCVAYSLLDVRDDRAGRIDVSLDAGMASGVGLHTAMVWIGDGRGDPFPASAFTLEFLPGRG